MPLIQLESFGITDVGLHRKNNEDAFRICSDLNFFALADGMGGKKAGEIASHTAIEQICSMMKKISTQDPVEAMIELRHAIEKANRHIFLMGQKSPIFKGMGTTFCCAFWIESAMIYAHVGDSRIYRLRENTLSLLTQDHSLLSQWVTMGHRIQEKRSNASYNHVITRALGLPTRANPEIALTSFFPKDIYLLCSDGLSDVLSFKEIQTVLCQEKPFQEKAERLIEYAKIKGSCDNITLLLINVPT